MRGAVLALTGALVLVLEGCSAPSPTRTAAPTPRPPTATPPGCATRGSGIPQDAVSGPIVDVDGDGKADTGWVLSRQTGETTAGFTTASGATSSVPFRSASPVSRNLFAADVDSKGTVAVILSDGRTARLFRVQNCALVAVTNPQGKQYEFDLGFGGQGTGIGCSQVSGTTGQTLVGLKLNLDTEGNPKSIARTQVIISGTHASNGASDTVPATGRDSAAVKSARTISCGNLTQSRNGINTPE